MLSDGVRGTDARRTVAWLSGLLLMLGLVTAPIWAGAQPGAAAGPVAPCANDWVCVVASVPAAPGGGGAGGGGGGGGGVQVCQWQGRTVPCTTEFGTFDPNDGCYYAPAQPQPPAGDLAWGGHQPGDGTIYIQTCPQQGGNGGVAVFMAQPPAAPPTVTPGQLAQQALTALQLQPTTVHTAPDGAAKTTALVGSPIWLWIDPGDRTVHRRFAPADNPFHAQAGVPGLTVTATVWVKQVTWDMGDGGTPRCTLPGTAYHPSFGASASPTCGYSYAHPSVAQPGQQYVISAYLTWTVSWVSTNGDKGAFDLDPMPALTTTLGVSELQVLN